MVLGRGSREDRGAVLVLVALLISGLLAMTAIVVDIGNARQVRRHAQASADAAVLAGAQDLPTSAAAILAAARYVNENLSGSLSVPATGPCPDGSVSGSTCYGVGDAKVAIKSPYDDPSSIAPDRLVYVRICQPTDTFFASAIGATSPTVCQEAVGRNLSTGGTIGMGLVALDPDDCKSLQFRGNSGTTLTSNGGVFVNSDCDAHALSVSGSSWALDAAAVNVVGGATYHPCDVCASVLPTTGVTAFADPYALSPPSPLPTPPQPCPSSGSGVKILLPGEYPACNFNGNRQFILRPGNYYFPSGFQSAGGAAMVCSSTANTYPLPVGSTCSGVTLFVGSGATFTMNGSGQVLLPPPTSGTYAGISIYQFGPGTSRINGTSEFHIGTVYVPAGKLELTGNGGGAEINITGSVVANTIDIGGTFDLTIDATGAPIGPGAPDIGLES